MSDLLPDVGSILHFSRFNSHDADVWAQVDMHDCVVLLCGEAWMPDRDKRIPLPDDVWYVAPSHDTWTQPDEADIPPEVWTALARWRLRGDT